jgi:hypothetical protein
MGYRFQNIEEEFAYRGAHISAVRHKTSDFNESVCAVVEFCK